VIPDQRKESENRTINSRSHPGTPANKLLLFKDLQQLSKMGQNGEKE